MICTQDIAKLFRVLRSRGLDSVSIKIPVPTIRTKATELYVRDDPKFKSGNESLNITSKNQSLSLVCQPEDDFEHDVMCVEDEANGRVYWRKENHGKLFSVNCPHYGDNSTNSTGYRPLLCKDSPLEGTPFSENAMFAINNEPCGRIRPCQGSGVLSCAKGFKLIASNVDPTVHVDLSVQCFGNGLTFKCQDNHWTSAIIDDSKAAFCQPVCQKNR